MTNHSNVLTSEGFARLDMRRIGRPISSLVGPSMGAWHNVPRGTERGLLDNQYHLNEHMRTELSKSQLPGLCVVTT